MDLCIRSSHFVIDLLQRLLACTGSDVVQHPVFTRKFFICCKSGLCREATGIRTDGFLGDNLQNPDFPCVVYMTSCTEFL